jgi:hypothetical protein
MNKLSATYQSIKNLNQPSATLFLILLLFGDLIYIALHIIEAFTPFLQNQLLSIERDRGYAEMYQYLKWIWIISLLVYISLQKRAFNYFAWVLVFTYFFFDDALHIHELVGGYIGNNLNVAPAFGLRLQDFGELIVSATAGISLIAFVMWAYRRGSQDFKNISKDILLLIGALVFFGVVVDMAHIAIRLGWLVTFILGVIEDGGEMLVVTLILWYTFMLSVRNDKTPVYLCDLVSIMLTPRKFMSVNDNDQIKSVLLHKSAYDLNKHDIKSFRQYR